MKNIKRKLLFAFLPLILITCRLYAYDLVVAKDGSGNFTTIQAAIDAAPAGRTAPFTIFIKNGKYKEVVTIPSSKPFLHLIGESVAGTLITYDNYSGKLIPGGGGSSYGTSNSATVFFNANDCAAYNISMENSTGYTGDGPQALAINVGGDRCVFKNCRFNGGQDTIYTGGGGKRNYFRNCYIDGNTDYIFGATISVFDSCIVYGRDRIDGGSGGIVTAANTPPGQTYGYVFRDCKIPPNRGATIYNLGRPWQNGCPPPPSSFTKVVFINTSMSNAVSAAAWQVWDACTVTSQVYYAEYKSKYFNGNLVNTSQRPAWTFQLSDTEAANYTTANMFGSWDPCMVWPDLCNYSAPELVVSNFRAQRGGSNSTISWNISWPMTGVTYNLYRSTDSANYTLLNTMVSVNDSTVAFSQADGLPATGTKYYYYLKASKPGLAEYNTETAVINVNVPLNGEYRSANSGPWSNNVSASSTITSGQVTSVAVSASPSGYTSAPAVTFTAAPSGGTTATGTAILTGGVVTGVNITSPGSGYTTAPSITFSTTGVGGNSVWEMYASSTSSWNPVTLGTGPSNVNATIRNGNTVTLNALAGVGSLTIESGAALNSISNALQGATQTIRVGNGTTPVTAFIRNDGIFGSTSGMNDGIVVEAASGCKNLTISGTGITSIARFRPLPGNLNNFSFVIDQDMDFNMSNNVGLTGYYNNVSNANAEVATITINANKIVRVTQPGGGFHTAATTSNQQGVVVYNINGTLDLSATNSIAMVPNSVNTASSVTMNIGNQGVFKTGATFTMTNTGGTTYGTSSVIVNPGGIFDAVRTATFSAGNNANSGYVVLDGGVLRRSVANTNVVFPIASSASSYTPVTINNAGLPDKFVVNVKTTFDQPLPDAGKAVSRQWIISEDTAGGSNATVSLTWTAAEQGVHFDPAAPVGIIRYNGSTWDAYQAIVSGTGTAASPYVATATGITSFSLFGVANLENSSGPLPVKLVSFIAVYNNNAVQTSWTTTDEINTGQFQVERSTDARSFSAINTVLAANRAGTNNYQFTDIAPLKGICYYRLKMVNNDGSFTYGPVVAVNTGNKSSLMVYPNPVKDQLQVLHRRADGNATIEIYSTEGKMLLRQRLTPNVQHTFLNLSTLAVGTYLLRCTNGSEQSSIHFSKQ